jgi:hypothetical protein
MPSPQGKHGVSDQPSGVAQHCLPNIGSQLTETVQRDFWGVASPPQRSVPAVSVSNSMQTIEMEADRASSLGETWRILPSKPSAR